MIDPARVPDVSEDETVARYIVYSRHVRSSNQTVKPDAFIPPPNRELSVTRHHLATDAQLWHIGEQVASVGGLTLHGRADLLVRVIRGQSLEITPDPVPDNPNHANVTKWPAEKPAQKIIAAELTKESVFRACPTLAPGESGRSEDQPLNTSSAAPAGSVTKPGWLVRCVRARWGFVIQGLKFVRAVIQKKLR